MKKLLYSVLIVFAAFFLSACTRPVTTTQNAGNQQQGTNETNAADATSNTIRTIDPNQPLLIKHLGVELGDYDPTTGKAGDFKFTKDQLSQNRIWMDYGYVIAAEQSSTRQDKPNPQPAFILPLGTKVHALVDGIVVSVEKLYSDDYSIMISGSEQSPWRYETEHVINPLVKVGDKVTAGQVIAEVSTWDSQHNSGLGMVEIGILKGGNPPAHVCPFAYLDPSIKDSLLQHVSNLYASWESYKGDTTLYDEAAMVSVGCIADEVSG